MSSTRPTIAIANHSTVVTDAEVVSWMAAIQQQMNGRFLRYWNCSARLHFGAASPTEWEGLILDDSDTAGALGYHDDSSPWGQPRLKVFAKTDQAYGLSPSITLSHEVCEAVVDPWISSAWQTSDTEFYAMEVCDPCEADALGYPIGGVMVSDFVLPAWFMPGSSGPFTCVGSRIADGIQPGPPAITTPLGIAAGGYMSIFTSGKGWGQVKSGAREAGLPSDQDPRARPR